MKAKYNKEDDIFDVYGKGSDPEQYCHSIDIELESLKLLEECGYIKILQKEN